MLVRLLCAGAVFSVGLSVGQDAGLEPAASSRPELQALAPADPAISWPPDPRLYQKLTDPPLALGRYRGQGPRAPGYPKHGAAR